jgi:glycerophosphoryl diester phosphodiesterase
VEKTDTHGRAGTGRVAAATVVGLLAALLAAVSAPASAAATARPAAFDLEAHRGGRGLFPENTLAAFRGALAIGVTTLETDLAVTRDGVLVVSHDPALDAAKVRGPDGRWVKDPGPLIHSLTLAELRRYELGRLDPASAYARNWPEQRPQDGERFPTLAEVLQLPAAGAQFVRFNLETKIAPDRPADTVDPETFARMVAAEVERTGVTDRVTVQSFDWRTLVAIRRIAPAIATACLTIESPDINTVRADASGRSPWQAGLARAEHGNSLPRLALAAGCGTWSMYWRNLSPADVAEAHALRLKVLPWTVNDRADMARLVDWEVDGIITDYPDRLREVMAAKGLPLP